MHFVLTNFISKFTVYHKRTNSSNYIMIFTSKYFPKKEELLKISKNYIS